MLETDGRAGISVCMAEELARILNDADTAHIAGNRHRVTAECYGLRGIDLAIVQIARAELDGSPAWERKG